MSSDEDLPPDTTGGRGGGAFRRDLITTPASAWVSVTVILAGFVAVGVALTLFTVNDLAGYIVLASGASLLVAGLVMARATHLMRDTE